MNRVLILAVLICKLSFAYAQTWQLAYSGRDIQYYDSGCHGLKIISSWVEDGDSMLVNYPYTTTGGDKVTDSVSWIGKRIIINKAHENVIVTSKGDSLTVRTKAMPGEKWEFLNIKGHVVEATLDSAYFDTLHGFIDSFKLITFKKLKGQPNSIFLESRINAMRFIVSKHHGIMEAVEIDAKYNDYFSFGNTKIEQTTFTLFTNKNFCRYAVGDTIQMVSGGNTKLSLAKTFAINGLHYDSANAVEYYYSNSRVEERWPSGKTPIPYYKTDTLSCKINDSLHIDMYPRALVVDKNAGYLYEYYHTYSLIGSCLTTSVRWQMKEGTYFEIWDGGYCSSGFCEFYIMDGSIGNGLQESYWGRISYLKNACFRKGRYEYIPWVPDNIENASIESIRIYPNPCSTTLAISDEYRLPKTIKIYDLNGKIMYAGNGYGETNIDVTFLNSGVYMLHLLDERGAYVRRIIKL